jgi:hypothetical protein
MDFAKFRQAIEDVRRHLDAGDKEAAITLFGETMGIDRLAAAAAVEKIAAGEPVTVTESSVTGTNEVSRQIEMIMEAVPIGGLAGSLLKLAGVDLSKLDLSKLKDAIEVDGEGKRVVTSRTTVRLSGGAGRHLLDQATHGDAAEAAQVIDSAAEGRPAPAPGPTATGRPRHVSVIDRPHGRTVERPGRGGSIVLVIILAIIAGVGIAFLLR